jgi:hypothetical protein
MAYHDDLLAHALELVHVAPPTQLASRRAVSAAYYAIFHFLISEATSNWVNISLRTALARAYDHGVMKTASNRIGDTKKFPFAGEDATVVDSLRFVAQTFSQLQEDRFLRITISPKIWLLGKQWRKLNPLKKSSIDGLPYVDNRSRKNIWYRSS